MFRALFFVMVAGLVFSPVFAHGFSTLVCKRTISDQFEVSVDDGLVKVLWTTRGSNASPLLRELADAAIPSELLSAYGHMLISFALPVEACEFDEKKLGRFSCDFEDIGDAIDLTIQARVSPYGKKPFDVYEGSLSGMRLDAVFSGKKGSRYVKFPMLFSVNSPSTKVIKAVTDFFFAHHWSSEGFGQNPSCIVDSVYLAE